jgi:hypothetical protein
MLFRLNRSNVALSTTNDFFTIITGATRSLKILEIEAKFDATTAATTEVGIFRVTAAGITGSGPIVPPLASESPVTATAFSGVVNTVWGTQPTVATLPTRIISANAPGDRYFWRCMPNEKDAIIVTGGGGIPGTLSVRSLIGTSAVTISLLIDEL